MSTVRSSAEPFVPGGGDVHQRQRQLDERQLAAPVQVEHGVRMAASRPEPGLFCVVDRAVDVESCFAPGPPGERVSPAQEVLSPAPGVLLDAERSDLAPQGLELLREAVGIVVGVVAGVEPDLMPPARDAPQQSPDPRIGQAVSPVEGRGATGEEGERPAQAGFLGDGHERVERVAGVGAEVTTATSKPAGEPTAGELGRAPRDDVGRCAPHHLSRAPP